jgi:hypothetical protein
MIAAVSAAIDNIERERERDWRGNLEFEKSKGKKRRI